MKPQNRLMSGLFLFAAAALLMSPSAAADCAQQCSDPKNLGGCAQGAASGAAAGGQFGANCFSAAGVNIVVNVAVSAGEIHQCSNEFATTATSCEGGDEGGDPLPRLR